MYNHKEIEKKWQNKWNKEGLYKTGELSDKPKYYILDMFPYPSGAGLHVGHPKGYIATDIMARMRLMQGYNVLHPMGWDAFGLPAENFAIKNKTHPRKMNEQNIATFKSQLEKLGFTYDWDREINTTDPEFYKWTQWAFLQMFKKGLAYESYEPINWCPKCQTGLANEDLENGRCERCDSEIEQKPMRQWVLRITDYADRMLDDLDKLPDWPEAIREMQRNWIGKSVGAKVEFKIKDTGDILEVFTTRPDTLFGCTFMVVAPEHPILENQKSRIKNQKEIEDYQAEAKKKTELERTELSKDKTGVKIEGISAINPVNGEEIPIFAADYVMMGYGTGAIMAVPAHDERDMEFALKYDIPVRQVVAPDLDAYNKTFKTLEILNSIKDVADKKGVKFWVLGGFACAAYANIIYREHSDLDLIAKTDDDYKKMLDIFVELGFEKVREKKISEKLTNSIYKNENDLEIDIGPYVKECGLINDDFDEEEKYIGKIKYKVISKRFTLSLKESQTEKRKKEYDKIDIEYLKGKTFTDNGFAVNSGFLDGLETAVAKEEIIKWLEAKNLGRKAVNYKLKDWVFSRQRYWGEPIPIIHCEKCGAVGVPEEDLPVKLPEVERYEPTGTGESPLANISEWVNTICPKCGGAAKRETNTMPQWAGSSWYYLRYIDPKNNDALVDKDKEKYWSPVDFYVGGAEHATRHLIYARFWHKFLFDIGVVNYEEPFTRLQNVGLIMAEDGRKMSKRWGNVINPDSIVESHGADAMRVYEMFMGPFNQACAWNTNGLTGARKFLEKVWNLSEKEIKNCTCDGSGKCDGIPDEMPRMFHKTVKKVGEDIEKFHFNTAISEMMILVNYLAKFDSLPKTAFEMFVKILAPFAPHMCEEIWRELGYLDSIFKETWPKFAPELAKDTMIELVVQVNGKVRAKIDVGADISEEDAKKMAIENEAIIKWIDDKEILKVVFVKGRLVNIVIRQ